MKTLNNLIIYSTIALSSLCTSGNSEKETIVEKYIRENEETYSKTQTIIYSNLLTKHGNVKEIAYANFGKEITTAYTQGVLTVSKVDENGKGSMFMDKGIDGLTEYDTNGEASIKDLSPERQLELNKEYVKILTEIISYSSKK
jgi:hypothetical protein